MIFYEFIDYHSLFVELTAKTLQKGCFNLAELRKKIQKGEFVKIERDFEHTFNSFLNERFKIETNQALKLLLQQLAVLPSIEIDYLILEEIFAGNSRLKVCLNELAKRGWLIKKENTYKLHQIIKEFILANHPAEFDASILPIIENINAIKGLDPADSYLTSLGKTYYIEIILSIYKVHYQQHSQIAELLDRLSNIYDYLGSYNKAVSYQKQSLKIREMLFGSDNEVTAKSYNHLAVLYEKQGKYAEALPLYEKSLAISEQCFGLEHPNTATSYHNLAYLHKDLKNCKQALDYAEKAITIYNSLDHVDPLKLQTEALLKDLKKIIKKAKKLPLKRRLKIYQDL